MVVSKDGFILTTLAYLVKDGSVLFLYRGKKKNDENEGKYIGVGGHLEKGESYVGCMKREVKEETGFDVRHFVYKGKIDFLNKDEKVQKERMYLFLVDAFDGEEEVCLEGDLFWIPKEKILSLPLWEGDKQFLPYLFKESSPFRMKLYYEKSWFVSSEGPASPKKVRRENQL